MKNLLLITMLSALPLLASADRGGYVSYSYFHSEHGHTMAWAIVSGDFNPDTAEGMTELIDTLSARVLNIDPKSDGVVITYVKELVSDGAPIKEKNKEYYL